MKFERTRFRECLIAHMERTKITAAALAEKAHVGKATIDKLRNRSVEATNVYDAIQIAHAFGMNVEDFMDLNPGAEARSEIHTLFAQLPESLQEDTLRHLEALVAALNASGRRKRAASADLPPLPPKDPATGRRGGSAAGA